MPTFAFLGNVRIGTKLGVAAAVGFVLVFMMAANEVRVHFLSQALNADMKAADRVNNAVMEAELGLRRIVIQNRTVRAATKTAEVETVRKRIKELEGETNKTLDAAIASAGAADIRDELKKVKALYASYAAVNLELAGVHNEVILLREEQSKAGRGWPADLKSVLESPALAAAANRADLVRLIERIDYEFKQARLLSWAKIVRPDDEIILKNIEVAFTTTLKLVGDGRGMAQDAAVKAGSDGKIEPIILQYKALVDKLSATTAREGAMMREKVDPIRIEADKITDDVKQSVRKLSLDAQASDGAEEMRTLWINMSASAIVLLVLVGAALFSLLNVARPIRRIGEVLRELANGNKDVDIPYAERGDEVGDNARAAKTFKDHLLRLQSAFVVKPKTMIWQMLQGSLRARHTSTCLKARSSWQNRICIRIGLVDMANCSCLRREPTGYWSLAFGGPICWQGGDSCAQA
jgi:methyl-accepting chemotaxis protein